MAYYCGECKTQIGSSDVDRYGRRWCSYSRRYEESNQQTYGCRGFSYVGRILTTKICDILGIENHELFKTFDEVKEEYLVPTEMGKLIDYNIIGTEIVNGLDTHPQKEQIATNMLNGYIIPAEAYSIKGKYEEAVEIYERMVKVLAVIFSATKEQIEQNKFYDELIKVR